MSFIPKDCLSTAMSYMTCGFFAANNAKGAKNNDTEELKQLNKTNENDEDGVEGGNDAPNTMKNDKTQSSWTCSYDPKALYAAHKDAFNIAAGALALLAITVAQAKTSFINSGLAWGAGQSALSINFGLSGLVLVSAAYIYRNELLEGIKTVGQAICDYIGIGDKDD